MVQKLIPIIDITDRADGKRLAWDAGDGVHKYVDAASVGDILDLTTAEMDDSLVLAPDGAGGVEFRAEAGGGGGGSPGIVPRTLIASGQSVNTGSHALTLPAAPSGSNPLLMAWACEDGTTQVSSITQTGSTWARLYRDVTTGFGLEVWATPSASGTGVTVNMSGTIWSHAAVVEVPGIAGTLDGHTTRAYNGTSQTPVAGTISLAIMRAGAGGPTMTIFADELSVPLINGVNGSVWYFARVPSGVLMIPGGSGTNVVSVATIS